MFLFFTIGKYKIRFDNNYFSELKLKRIVNQLSGYGQTINKVKEIFKEELKDGYLKIERR